MVIKESVQPVSGNEEDEKEDSTHIPNVRDGVGKRVEVEVGPK